MKKKGMTCSLLGRRLRKILLIMTLKVFILLVAFSSVSAMSYSQEQKMDVVFHDEMLENVLEYLKANTDYEFVYRRESLGDFRVKNVELKDVTLKQILDQVLCQNGFDYEIVDKIVIIRKLVIPQQKKEIKITGQVTDEKKQPMPGVTVVVKGLTIGTATDADGKYVLKLPEMKDLAILFSFIGMETMEVKYTNSWASFDLEKECADALISDGCVLISQHADTTGAPTACEAAGVPCVGYNIDMTSVAPNTALTSASMDWGVYYTYAVQCMLDGTAIDTDWCKGFAEGADKITALNDKTVAEGTEEKVKEVEDALIDGSLHVFDTSAFTVDGKELDTYKKGDTEYISDGYFHESEYGSAPAFDIAIDGITSITE